MQYLVLAFRYSSFVLPHFQAVMRQYFLSQFFDRLVSTEVA